MRSLERNKIIIYYALYGNQIPILDDFGNNVGQTTTGYFNPVKIKARVSPNKGESQSEAFGIATDYDRVITTTDRLPLEETSILWIDILPIIEGDGSTLTQHNYIVKKVAPDINVHQYAIKKRVI